MFKKKIYLIPLLGLILSTTCMASYSSDEDGFFRPNTNLPAEYAAYEEISEEQQMAILAAMTEVEQEPAKEDKDGFPYADLGDLRGLSEADQLAIFSAMEEQKIPLPATPPLKKQDFLQNHSAMVEEQDKTYQQTLAQDRLLAIQTERVALQERLKAFSSEDLQSQIENLQGRLSAVGGKNPRIQQDLDILKRKLTQVEESLAPIVAKMADLDQEEESLLTPVAPENNGRSDEEVLRQAIELSMSGNANSQKGKEEEDEDDLLLRQALELSMNGDSRPDMEEEDEMLHQAMEESLKGGRDPSPQLPMPAKIYTSKQEEIAEIEAQIAQNLASIEDFEKKKAENERAMQNHYSYRTENAFIQHSYVRTNKELQSRQDGLAAQNLMLQERLDALRK